jgi:hypothetical protein
LQQIGGESALPQCEAEVIDETTAHGKLVAQAKQRNAVAMANLTIAFEMQGSLGMIYAAMSSAWPAGSLAHEVVAQLFKKFCPDDQKSRVELRSMLNKVAIKAHQDPSSFFERVSSITNRYYTVIHTIDEEESIAVIMGAAPKEYISVITMEERIKGDQMTLKDREAVMYQQWRQTNGPTERQETEIILAAFGGFCYQYKQKGHKADSCANRRQVANGGRSTNSSGR